MGMAENIKRLRLERGWTQEELGKKVGLQKSAIAKYENGRVSNMRRPVIHKMAEVFGVDPSFLMGFEESGTEEKLFQLALETSEQNEMLELLKQDLLKKLLFAGGHAPEEAVEFAIMALEAAAKKSEEKK